MPDPTEHEWMNPPRPPRDDTPLLGSEVSRLVGCGTMVILTMIAVMTTLSVWVLL